MTRKYLVGVVLMLMVALGRNVPAQSQDWADPGDGFRQDGEHAMGQRLLAMLENDRIKAELGFTDEQTDRLRRIMVDTQKSTIRTRADMALRAIELRELLRSDKPDHEAVMNKVQEISKLRNEMMKGHVEALLATKAVLTPEQQKKIRGLIESGPRAESWRGRPWRQGGELPHGPGGVPERPHHPGEAPIQ